MHACGCLRPGRRRAAAALQPRVPARPAMCFEDAMCFQALTSMPMAANHLSPCSAAPPPGQQPVFHPQKPLTTALPRVCPLCRRTMDG